MPVQGKEKPRHDGRGLSVCFALVQAVGFVSVLASAFVTGCPIAPPCSGGGMVTYTDYSAKFW